MPEPLTVCFGLIAAGNAIRFGSWALKAYRAGDRPTAVGCGLTATGSAGAAATSAYYAYQQMQEENAEDSPQPETLPDIPDEDVTPPPEVEPDTSGTDIVAEVLSGVLSAV